MRSLPHRARLLPGILLGFLVITGVPDLLPSSHAQSREVTSALSIRAKRIADSAPEVDGRLDDAAWRDAVFISDFLQKDPKEGAPASERTDVAFLYDDEAVYIGARMHCPDPKRHIRSGVSRRDNVGNSERFIVTLDTYRDRRTAYSFAVTASGSRADYYHPIDHEYQRDYSWDPIWEARTTIDSTGWTAEIRIPFSQLRFKNQDVQEWGINYNRYVSSESEDAFLAYVPKNATGWSSYFPALTGVDSIQPRRRLEVVPYVAADGRFGEEIDDDPFHDGSEFDGRAGGDLKLGLGPNLTLDATINPDFGQVEADPAEVNLTAYETFFPERRPFFTEGSQLLAGDGPNYFYSRRIGAAPHRSIQPGEGVVDAGTDSVLDADFHVGPENSTILGAAKVTGRLNSGLSIGFLSAVTDDEWASIADTLRAEGIPPLRRDGRTLIEPLTFYGVTRFQQEFGRTASTVGVSLTAVGRDLPEGEVIEQAMNRGALTGGADWNLRFGRGRYRFSGSFGMSHVSGEPAAIARQQTSSRRYYQRPDADYVSYDPTRTTLSGTETTLALEKVDGRRWVWSIGAQGESPGFELNDMGSLNSADDLDAWGSLTYRVNEPGKLFRSHSSAFSTGHGWNFGGAPQYRNLVYDFNAQLKDFTSVWAGGEVWGRAKDDALTRGGPLAGTGGGGSLWTGASGNRAANLFWELGGSASRNELGGWGFGVDGELRLRAGGRWEMSLRPSYQRTRPVRQYVDTIDRDDPSGPTYGTRYIFSYLDQSTISAQLRLNYSFTPDLTLELYAEPFASSGRFSRFGELESPGERPIRYYGENGTTITEAPDDPGSYDVTDGADTFRITRPNFDVLSFRSNLVLRWEYTPGSTFFLVWQQSRAEEDQVGEMVDAGRLLDSFSADGANYLAAKITWWIPVN